MKNWTIGKRIAFGFAGVLLLFAAVAGISFVLLQEVSRQQRLLTRHIMPGLETALTIKVNASAIQMLVLQHMFARTDDQKSALEEKIHAYTRDNAAAVTNYEKQIISAEDQAQFEQLKTARHKYSLVRDPLLALSRDGKLFEALQLNVDSVQPARDAYEKQCDEFVAVKQKQAAAANQASEKAVGLANAIIIGAALAAIIFGCFIATCIVRSLSKTLSRLAGHLDDGSNQLATAASEVAAESQSLAEGASEQASSLEETSASLRDMSSMTKRNADGAESAKELSNQTRAAADAGAADIEEMGRAMAEVKAASGNIAKIIKTIDEIAFQTNILALNASVEAARAGASGAGFAVVANEVRNLAQRSAQAAKETADKIENSIQKSERGAEISDKVRMSLEQIVLKARQMDELVGQIAVASQEQSHGFAQVNIAVTQIEKLTQANAGSAEKTASASEEMSAHSQVVKETVAELAQMVGIKSHGGAPAKTVRPQPLLVAKPKSNGHAGHARIIVHSKVMAKREMPRLNDN